jgi:hypothetical protein
LSSSEASSEEASELEEEDFLDLLECFLDFLDLFFLSLLSIFLFSAADGLESSSGRTEEREEEVFLGALDLCWRLRGGVANARGPAEAIMAVPAEVM